MSNEESAVVVVGALALLALLAAVLAWAADYIEAHEQRWCWRVEQALRAWKRRQR